MTESPEATATAEPPTQPVKAFVEHIMGMPISIHVRGPEARTSARIEEKVRAVYADLHEVDRVFSTWKPESQVSRLSRGEIALADCDPLVQQVVELCNEAKELCEGYFDTMIPDETGKLRFDPTGLVKGWAVQRAARFLDELDDHDYYVNAGGDIALGHRRSDTEPWQIGIENPEDTSQIAAVISLGSGGMATSGNAARGKHIYDPVHGVMADRLLSISIAGPSLMWADVFATAAFARGPECREWLATLPGYLSVIIETDGKIDSVIGPTDGTVLPVATSARTAAPRRVARTTDPSALPGLGNPPTRSVQWNVDGSQVVAE